MGRWVWRAALEKVDDPRKCLVEAGMDQKRQAVRAAVEIVACPARRRQAGTAVTGLGQRVHFALKIVLDPE